MQARQPHQFITVSIDQFALKLMMFKNELKKMETCLLLDFDYLIIFIFANQMFNHLTIRKLHTLYFLMKKVCHDCLRMQICLYIIMDYWNNVAAIQTTVPKLSNIYQNENNVLSKNKGKINEKGGKQMNFKDDDIDVDEKIHEENPYGDFYINEEPLVDIAIEQLWNVIEEKSRNEDDGFKKEYAVGNDSSVI